MEVLQTSALPLGDGAGRNSIVREGSGRWLDAATTARRRAGRDVHRQFVVHRRSVRCRMSAGAVDILRAEVGSPSVARSPFMRAKDGAGNGIRTRDFDLGKVALYH